MKECVICGRPNSHEHHRIYRSECKPLEHCKKNIVYLCYEHHQSTYGVHGKYGSKLNRKLKLEFQNWLEMSFLKEHYTLEEIREILDISHNAVISLSKHLKIDKGYYIREQIIRACMSGKLVVEDEEREG